MDTEKGLYKKYIVERADDPTGKHDMCKYFVLDPKHDKFARAALWAYLMECKAEYPELAKDLEDWLDGIHSMV